MFVAIQYRRPFQTVQTVQCLAAVQKFQRSRFKVRLTQRRNFHVSGILETSKYKLAPEIGDDPT